MFDIIDASRYFQLRNTVVTVGTTVTPICGNEPQRALLYICNGSSSSIALFLGSSGTFNQPFMLLAAQSNTRFQWPLDGFLTTLPYWALSATTPQLISITEIWFRPTEEV